MKLFFKKNSYFLVKSVIIHLNYFSLGGHSMRRAFFAFLFINLFFTTFSKSLVFNFNTPTGKVEYFKAGDINTESNYFYNGTLTLNLEEKEYYFLLTSENFPPIQKIIDIKTTNDPIQIFFSKDNYVCVTGTVTSDYLNIGNVTVSFINSENKSFNFITDIFGKFIAYIPVGSYSVEADRFGYTLNKKNKIIYNFTSTTKPYSLNLNLVELPCFIQGKVVDEDGHTIPYPKIFVKNGKNIIQGEGDEFGMFKFPVDSGIVTILAQKYSFLQNGVVRKVEKNSSITNIEISLSKIKYNISGTIVDGIKALPGMELQLVNEDNSKIATIYSDETGNFEFYKIPGNRKIFILVIKNGKILKRSPLITLDKNIKNFNIILDQ